MIPYKYVTYGQIEQQAVKHYHQYGIKPGFLDVVHYLFNGNQYQEGIPDLPRAILWSLLEDPAFFEVLNHLPVSITFSSAFHKTDTKLHWDETFWNTTAVQFTEYSISAEAIMPSSLEVYAIKYVQCIIEKMHIHDFFEVNYVLSGSCEMIFENEIRRLQAGDFCVIAPFSRHDVTTSDGSVVLSLMLRKNTFETTFFKLLEQEDLLSLFFRNILYSQKQSANYLLFVTDTDLEIKKAVKDIFMECYLSDAYSNTCVVSRVHLLFSYLLRHYGNTIQFYDDQRSILLGGHQSFTQLLQYIQSHYQSVTLQSLSQSFHYNPSYLSRMIKKNTGRTLLDILTNLKISKASSLLLHTDLKVDEIAKLSGYDSVDHFSRQFKRKHLMSPTQYRHKTTNQFYAQE